mgnify:CR=1 FL=1
MKKETKKPDQMIRAVCQKRSRIAAFFDRLQALIGPIQATGSAGGFDYQCNLVTEKDFVLRYDKATIKKEVANMKIKLNPDQEIVNTIREGLKRTGGYCPCRRERTEATKCMCQEFKDQIADPLFEGFCHCMLYYKSLQD